MLTGNRLQVYKQKHGDCLVPQGYKSADGFGLAVWVNSQRTKRDGLSPDRRQKLEEAGFVGKVR